MKNSDGAFGFFALIAIVAGLFYWLTNRTKTAAAAAVNTANPANAMHPVFSVVGNRSSVIGQNVAQGTTATAVGAAAAAGAGWLSGLFASPQPVIGAVPGMDTTTVRGSGAVASSIVNNPQIPVFMPATNNGLTPSVDNLINSFQTTTPVMLADQGITIDPYNQAVYNTDASFVNPSIIPITSDTSDTNLGAD